MKLKVISAVLLSILILSSCGAQPAAEENRDISQTAGDVPESEDTQTESETSVQPVLPDIDRGGETITVLYREAMKNEFMADDQNGEIVNDAIYKKNLAVEEQFNIKLDKSE